MVREGADFESSLRREPQRRLPPERGTTMAEDNRSIRKTSSTPWSTIPPNPPQLQALSGYRGRSAEEGHTRLYLDPELSAWVDIPDEAILLTRETHDELRPRQERGLGPAGRRRSSTAPRPPQEAARARTSCKDRWPRISGRRGGLRGPRSQFPRTQLGCPTHAPLPLPPDAAAALSQDSPVPDAPHGLLPAAHVEPGDLPVAGDRLHVPSPLPAATHLERADLPQHRGRLPDPALPYPERGPVHPAHSPQICQAATPNPGCFPGGTSEIPAAPWSAARQARRPLPTTMAFQTHHLSICQPASPPGCPTPPHHAGHRHHASSSGACRPARTHPFSSRTWPSHVNRAFQAQAVHAGATQCSSARFTTVFCPVFTHDFHHCHSVTPRSARSVPGAR